MKNLFIDADVILDLLLERIPFHEPASELFARVENGKYNGHTSTIVIANLHYLIEKAESKNVADRGILKLLKLLFIIPIQKDDFINSLNSSFNDFEDGAQYYASLRSNMDFIITRNIKDDRHSKIKVLNPHEFIRSYDS